MKDPKESRPTFIRATNVEGLVMEDNLVVGDVDFAQLDNVSNVQASGNIHQTSGSNVVPPDKPWYERPAWLWVLTLLATVAGGGILYWVGWV